MISDPENKFEILSEKELVYPGGTKSSKMPKFKASDALPPEHVLTIEDIVDAVGNEDLDTRDEVEIIFGNFTEIGGLESCHQLLAFTMINTGLQRIGSGLQPVAMTLERLCLCDQKLTRIEGLHLPVLRELLLHQNSISRIEGLDGLPRLQRLWLFENKISRIEGLSGCGEIRELWLQNNKIPRISGLSSAVHLASLNLSGEWCASAP